MLAVATSGIVIQSEETRGSLTVLETRCEGFDHYRELPDVVKYNGVLFGKTGWNSDRNVAYYRNDARIALAVA